MNKMLGLVGALLILSGAAAPAGTSTVTLSVDNMTCATCPVIVRAALYDLNGVENVVVSMKERAAVVTFDDQQVDVEDLTEATTNAGFPARVVGPVEQSL